MMKYKEQCKRYYDLVLENGISENFTWRKVFKTVHEEFCPVSPGYNFVEGIYEFPREGSARPDFEYFSNNSFEEVWEKFVSGMSLEDRIKVETL